MHFSFFGSVGIEKLEMHFLDWPTQLPTAFSFTSKVLLDPVHSTGFVFALEASAVSAPPSRRNLPSSSSC